MSTLVAAAGLSCVLLPGSANAEGSRDLYPSAATCGSDGSCRANLEWRTDDYGAAGSTVLRRTLFTVYAKQGEVLEMGSSAVGVGDGDIVVWKPGVITDDQAANLPAVDPSTNGFSCSDQRLHADAATGMITSRAQEQAGPQAVTGGGNPGGYVPCHYEVPADGLYKVAFYGPAGADDATDGHPTGDIGLDQAADFDATQGSSVSAWDLTVRSGDISTTDLPGRVFTYALAGSTGGTGRPVDEVLYATTPGGYVYKVDTHGVDPDGFVTFGNEVGRAQAPAYPLSFEPLSPEALDALGIDAHPTAPTMSGLTFEGADAGHAYAGEGGTFTFQQNVPGTYHIVVSRDGNDFASTTSTNRLLEGVVGAGVHTVHWDGEDNAGHAFPAGSGYAVRAEVRAGGYCFCLLDGGSSTTGTPTVTLHDAPAGSPSSVTGTTADGLDPWTYVPSDHVETSLDVLDVPQATDDRGSTVTGHTLQVTAARGVLANDHGATLAVSGHTAPSHGSVSIDPDGSYTYRPLKGWSGRDSFRYTATDAAAQPVTATVALTVTPSAVHDSAWTALTTPIWLNPVSNDVGSGLRVVSVTRPEHGAVLLHAGRVLLVPERGFSGTLRFRYTVRDASDQTSSAAVSVRVRPSDAAITPDEVSTDPGKPVSFDPTTNDPGRGTFVRGSVMLADARLDTFVRTLPTKAGRFTVDAATGSVRFTPARGFVGRVWNVTYVVSDQAGRLHHSTIMVHIGDQGAVPGRSVGGGLRPGRGVVAAAGGTASAGAAATAGAGLKPGRVIAGELASTGNPVDPLLPLAGFVLVGAGVLLVRRRPSR